MTKATTAEGDDIRRSFNWVVSRRGWLKVYTDRLECGNWVIPYDDIEEAVVFRVRQGIFPGYVLRVKAQGQIYQFGLNPSRYWAGDLPFAATRARSSLGYSWYSIVARILAIGCLGYFVWRRLH